MLEDIGSGVEEVMVEDRVLGSGGRALKGDGGKEERYGFGEEMPEAVVGAVVKEISEGGWEVGIGGFCIGFLEVGVEAVMADEAVVDGLVVPAGPFEEVAGEGVGPAVEAVTGLVVGGGRWEERIVVHGDGLE